MGGDKRFKRVCKDCGKFWFVEARELKGPGLGELLDKGFGLGKTRKRAKDVRELRRQADARIASLGHCPNCNSTRYAEEPA